MTGTRVSTTVTSTLPRLASVKVTPLIPVTSCVCLRWLNEYVRVLGEPRLGVDRQSVSADQQVLGPVKVSTRNERQDFAAGNIEMRRSSSRAGVVSAPLPERSDLGLVQKVSKEDERG